MGKGKGKHWIEQTLGWTAEIVAHFRRPSKVGIFHDLPNDLPDDLPDDQIDWSKYLPPPGFRVPRRWAVERTFAWQSQSLLPSLIEEWQRIDCILLALACEHLISRAPGNEIRRALCLDHTRNIAPWQGKDDLLAPHA